MRYMGGKARIAKAITEEILSVTRYTDTLIEPFMGGGWMTASLAPHFKEVFAYDAHKELVFMWESILNNEWVPPTETSKEEYQYWRASGELDPMKAFLGFGMSFAGRYYEGYTGGGNRDEIEARKKTHRGQSDYINPARNGLIKKADIIRANTLVACLKFNEIQIQKGVTLYCDPPYVETKGYNDIGPFDSKEFWTRCHEWSEVSDVFVSEMAAPADWEIVWEAPVRRTVKKDDNRQPSVERLFYRGPKSRKSMGSARQTGL